MSKLKLLNQIVFILSKKERINSAQNNLRQEIEFEMWWVKHISNPLDKEEVIASFKAIRKMIQRLKK